MQLGGPQRRQQFIHWIVAHAAAAGAVAALIDSHEFGYSELPFEPKIRLFFGIVCAILLFKAQELILRQAKPLTFSWIVQTFVAGLLGGASGVFIGLWTEWLLSDAPRVAAGMVATLAATLIAGSVFGWIQGMGTFRSWREHLAWVVIHAVIAFPIVFLTVIVIAVFRVESLLLMATVAGASYGLVTASCLFWLPLPLASEASPPSE